LPIKPVYANLILDGTKRYEFRRSRLREDLTHVIIYSASPVKKIVGIAEVARVKKGSPSVTWKQTKRAAGISRSAFREYFSGTGTAVVISLGRVVRLAKELDPSEMRNDFRVPQSFSYVDLRFFNRVLTAGLKSDAK
jgi:predicted transcriptional regulator